MITVNLYYIQLNLYNVTFSNFLSNFESLLFSEKQDIILQLDKSSLLSSKIDEYYDRYYLSEECNPEYIEVFRFFFKQATEIFYSKDKYDKIIDATKYHIQ